MRLVSSGVRSEGDGRGEVEVKGEEEGGLLIVTKRPASISLI